MSLPTFKHCIQKETCEQPYFICSTQVQEPWAPGAASATKIGDPPLVLLGYFLLFA